MNSFPPGVASSLISQYTSNAIPLCRFYLSYFHHRLIIYQLPKIIIKPRFLSACSFPSCIKKRIHIRLQSQSVPQVMKNPEDCKSLDHSECYELGLHDIHPDRHTLGISPACIACEQAISTGEFVLACLSIPLEVYLF